MEKITMKDFEKRLVGDEVLTAKAKAITGSDEEQKQKIIDLAASLGYEIDFENRLQTLIDEDMARVAGGIPQDGDDYHLRKYCPATNFKKDHIWVEIRRDKGWIWDTVYYRCSRCNQKKDVWKRS